MVKASSGGIRSKRAFTSEDVKVSKEEKEEDGKMPTSMSCGGDGW